MKLLILLLVIQAQYGETIRSFSKNIIIPAIPQTPKITSKMNNVTLEIFHRIINSAAEGRLYVDFSVDMFIIKYKQNELPLPEMRNAVLSHLKVLFQPVKFKYYGMNRLGYAIYRASWKSNDYIDYDYSNHVFGIEEHNEL